MSMLKQAKVVPGWGPAACIASISDELTWKRTLVTQARLTEIMGVFLWGGVDLCQ